MSQPEVVTAERIRHHVERLAGEIGERNIFGPAALAAAREYIEAEWSEQGYQVSLQWYATSGHPCANLEVARGGSSRPEQILLVGAHYDSVRGSPGADDNATGVAALLEISRLFAAVVPSIAVRFVAFVNEEPPFFLSGEQGSMMYARSAPDRGDFLAFVSDFRSHSMLLRMARLFRAHSGFPLEHVATFRFVPGVAWSDHRSFWRHGYRALMVTDTAFYRNPHYHRAEDTPDKLAYPQLAHVTNGLFRSLAVLARQGFDPA